jgi:hypothetical protein
VINTLMTEPELVEREEQIDLANRVRRQHLQNTEDSLGLQQYSSVENGEVHDDDEQAISQRINASTVSESEVRDDDEYTDAQ